MNTPLFETGLFDGTHDAAPENGSAPATPAPTVECLGHSFADEAARREYFAGLLREHLRNPDFRALEGFPIGSDEDILALSDPPYYTACPNPFLPGFIEAWEQENAKRTGAARDEYARVPFAADVSEGKNDPIYNAHSYHTKVPHRAIIRYILHYTEPGDIVFDGFCGTGMTGVAAQMCADRKVVESLGLQLDSGNAVLDADANYLSHLGARRAILNDLGPAATFIADNYNLPFDVAAFAAQGRRILQEVERECGWMYETLHADGKTKGRIDYTVWSEVFACPECGGEVVFLDEALNTQTGEVRGEFPCPRCTATLTKDNLERVFDTKIDPADSSTWKHVKFQPAFIHYRVGAARFSKPLDEADRETLRQIERLPLPASVPTNRFPIEQMSHGSRIAPKGFTHTHHFYLPRAAQALGALWAKVEAVPDPRGRQALFFWIEQAIWGMSLMNRYSPSHFSQVNRQMTGVYYVSSQISEVSPHYNLANKLEKLAKAFQHRYARRGSSVVNTGTAAQTALPDARVDYIFTDPPFGENIYYADLNFLIESWHRVWTNARDEAIVDSAKKKGLPEYQGLMTRCFREYHRLLKPGRWMTVEFHNSRNSVWNAIQEALQHAGFVVADVRTLDKLGGSYRQVTSSAVKQDLIISAYKPHDGLEERFKLVAGTDEGVWDFVRSHLKQLPVFVSKNGQAEVTLERTHYLLFDRMVAFHVQRGVLVPMSAAEFYAGLLQRFPTRDGMVFLTEQVAEYDRKRMNVRELLQLQLFVNDEASAIQWLKQQLTRKPQTFQELHPQFVKELGGWQKHEKPLELSDLLSETFLRFDGRGPIPAQLVSWMKQSERLRPLIRDAEARTPNTTGAVETQNGELLSAARDRWYVPDPNRATDLEKLRERALLREFDDVRDNPARKLKTFRLEALRAGFMRAWREADYKTIVSVAAKIPDAVLQEDPKLLQFYDNAQTRLGHDF